MIRQTFLAVLVACCFGATSASAVGIGLSVDNATPSVSDTITFTVSLIPDAPATSTDIFGFDLFFGFDAAELSFVSATPAFGAFVPAPNPGDNVSAAVPSMGAAVLELSSSPRTDLFSVTFNVIALIDDAAPDFAVEQGIGGIAPITTLTPDSASFSLVPEPTQALLLALGLGGLATIGRRRAVRR